MRGLWKHLTPFAPDQSGASAVLYSLGGIIVVVDAGGCTGNICGFDEPRWQGQKSAIFSAGLRDMDAIMGRDERLVAKLADVAGKIDAGFAALVGTPVPSVIGTDLPALARMAERRCELPVIAVETSGMRYYDEGASKAYLALLERFATEKLVVEPGRVGVLGATPLDFGSPAAAGCIKERLEAQGARRVCLYGLGGLSEIREASTAERNLVVSPSGLAAARWLERRFGTPYTCEDPLAAGLLGRVPESYDTAMAGGGGLALQVPPVTPSEDGEAVVAEASRFNPGSSVPRRALVVHQQVCANGIRCELEARGVADVTVASWFMLDRELSREGDVRLTGEDQLAELLETGGYDLFVGDRETLRVEPSFCGAVVDAPHFALSGRLEEPWS